MATTLNASSSSGLITTADTSTVLQLQTNGTAALTIDASANVGIGTSSPLTPLHVVGAIQSQRTGGVSQYARMVNSGGTATFISDNQASGTYTGFQFQGLSTASGTPTTYATIDGSGNVGIGTTTPSKLLQVTNADRTVGSTQVLLEGSYNAYGTGISFQSRTSSGGTLVEMARIVADGEDNWNTTASTQDAGLRFFTTLNGSSAEKMRIASDGSVLVGGTGIGINRLVSYGGFQSNSSQQFNIYSTGSSTDFEWVLRTGARQLYYVNNATVVASLSLTGVWTNASDARYKENITDSQYGLATVMALKPRAYNLIDQADKPQIGFIAQEVLDVVPEVVDSVHNSVTDEDRYTLSYGNMVAVLTKAIQEQQAIIQTLTDRITALEGTTP